MTQDVSEVAGICFGREFGRYTLNRSWNYDFMHSYWVLRWGGFQLYMIVGLQSIIIP